jgi:hypothetical protein
MMLDRRSVLQSAGVGFLTSFSGCSAFTQDQPVEATISEIYVNNIHDEPHTVHLLIFEKSSDEPMEPVYFRSKRFEANNPSEKFESGGGFFEGFPAEPGNYHVEIRLEDREWDSIAVSQFENLPDRIVITVTIGYTFKEDGVPEWKVTLSETKQ